MKVKLRGTASPLKKDFVLLVYYELLGLRKLLANTEFDYNNNNNNNKEKERMKEKRTRKRKTRSTRPS